MKKISVVTPTYNEEENISELVSRVKSIFGKLASYDYEILIIDNCSTDKTRAIIRDLCNSDSRIKAIFNTRNFGHIRSPYYGILQSEGDATIYLASDLQDPPEYIEEFLDAWERGYKLVMATKPVSRSNFVMHSLRKIFYRLVNKISDINLINDCTGFGLYDRCVVKHLRDINDPYPFLRGLICELGYPVKTIQFDQPRRLRGLSKNNIYTLYDIAMLGIISHSMVPIRLASFAGFVVGGISLIIAFFYLLFKLFFWDSLPIGVAPLIIGISLMFGILFIFIGILGEYVGAIHTFLQKRPIVVESERINFD
jgi:dolichol-phosphate mannosyltransferase